MRDRLEIIVTAGKNSDFIKAGEVIKKYGYERIPDPDAFRIEVLGRDFQSITAEMQYLEYEITAKGPI